MISKLNPDDRHRIIKNVVHYLFESIEVQKQLLITSICQKNYLVQGFRYKGECYLLTELEGKTLPGGLPILSNEYAGDWEKFLETYAAATTHKKKIEWILAEILGKLPDAHSVYLFFPESLKEYLGIDMKKINECQLEPILNEEEIQKLRTQFAEKLLFLESAVLMKMVFV